MNKFNQKEKDDYFQTNILSFKISLTKEQQNFIFNPLEKNSYLKACPGSGKTEVVGIKASLEIDYWKEKFCGIAILTFTNNAAKEIKERINKYQRSNNLNSHPHFIGTIDSWIHKYMLHPFGHRSTSFSGRNDDKSFKLIDSQTKYSFLNSFRTTLKYSPYESVEINQYYYECSEPTVLQSNISNYRFDNSLPETVLTSLKENKKKFWKAGLCTYADAEFLTYYLLKNNKELSKILSQRFPVLIVDECQDISKNQLEILSLFIKNGSKIHLIGDMNQSIYEFKKVYTEDISKFISRHKLHESVLTKNFRSNQKIVNISQKLEEYNTGKKPLDIEGKEPILKANCCILWEYDPNKVENLAEQFILYIKDFNSNLKNNEKEVNIQHSAILARGHSTLQKLNGSKSKKLSKTELLANGINIYFRNEKASGKLLKDSINKIGLCLCQLGYNGYGNFQHQYCPPNYDQFQWRNLINKFINDAVTYKLYPFKEITWNNWIRLLREYMEEFWNNLEDPVNCWDDAKRKIKVPNGFKNKQIKQTLIKTNDASPNIRKTTFHDIKGETLDAALVISSKDKRSKGGHVEHWISKEDKEFTRFAYVASSRPKHILIWAVPKNISKEKINKVLSLGFNKVNIDN